MLRSKPDKSFVYGMPRTYRAVMALIFAFLAAAIAWAGEAPGVVAWAILAVVALAGLYEDKWTFDPKSGELSHRIGLIPLARRRTIPAVSIARFRIEGFVRGTVPGSRDEAEAKASLREKGAQTGLGRKLSFVKKPYLCLVCETDDSCRYFIDAAEPRRADRLRSRAAAMASACGVPLEEG